MAESVREMSDEQVVHRSVAVERELVETRFRHSMSLLEDTSTLRRMRRGMAGLKTDVRRREIEQGLAKGALEAKHRTTYGITGPTGDTSASQEKGGFLKGIVDKLTGTE